MADLVYYMMFTMLGLGLGEKGNLKGIVLITCDMTEYIAFDIICDITCAIVHDMIYYT